MKVTREPDAGNRLKSAPEAGSRDGNIRYTSFFSSLDTIAYFAVETVGISGRDVDIMAVDYVDVKVHGMVWRESEKAQRRVSQKHPHTYLRT